MGSNDLDRMGVIVVYKTNDTIRITNFLDKHVDDFLNPDRKKPLVADADEILAVGQGTRRLWNYFVETFGIVE